LVIIFRIHSKLLGFSQVSCFLPQNETSPQSLKPAAISQRSGTEHIIRRKFHSYLEPPHARKPAHILSSMRPHPLPTLTDLSWKAVSWHRQQSAGESHTLMVLLFIHLLFLKCYTCWKSLSLAERSSNQHVLFKLRYCINFGSEYTHLYQPRTTACLHDLQRNGQNWFFTHQRRNAESRALLLRGKTATSAYRLPEARRWHRLHTASQHRYSILAVADITSNLTP